NQIPLKILILVCITTLSWNAVLQAQSPTPEDQAVTLKVGDPAPVLTYAKWYKGAPVEQFQRGHVYVVEFWATWCGPCRMAMPHLSELARTYRDQVTVIGYNVRENRDP